MPDLIPLTDPAQATAEAILLHLHYAVDWRGDPWIVDQLKRYWDEILPGRVRTAAYRSTSLVDFWALVAETLPLAPVQRSRRLELANLLRYEPAPPVIEVLKTKLPALIMRVQIIAAATREGSAVNEAPTTDPESLT